MTDHAQVQRDADELTKTLVSRASSQAVEDVTLAAFVQAHFANQVGQAIIMLLHHKNFCSESELNKVLADAYFAADAKLKQGSAIIIPRAPMLKPNGSF